MVMDRQAAIAALIAAIQAGDKQLSSVGGWMPWIDPMDRTRGILPYRFASMPGAYHRCSLDTAKALHDALLPGWLWGRQVNGAMWVAKRPYTFRGPVNMDPARAWLVAILKAYQAQLAGVA